MTVIGDREIFPGPLPVGAVALGSVGAALTAASDLAMVLERPGAVSVRAQWVEDSFDSLRHLRIGERPAEAFAPLSGFYEAADGWVRTHANYAHHRAALLRALRLPEEAGAHLLRRAVVELPAVDVAERVVRAGGVAAPVLSPVQWRAHPAYGSPVGAKGRSAVDRPDASAAARIAARGRGVVPTRRRLPLAGARVVSLTRVIAGPTAARLLAALGAQVTRVDPPQLPELHDQHLDTDFGVDARLADLRRPSDREAVHRLLSDSDGLLVGYRPGSTDVFGLGAEELMRRHPHLAVVSLSAWDPAGAWGARRGFDSIVQAVSGIAHVYAGSDGPGRLPVQALDHATGFRAAAALMRMWAEGRAGMRRFALSDVAAQLLGDVPDARTAETGGPTGESTRGSPEGARTPELGTMASGYGELRYVPPPVALDGIRLDYASPPTRARPLL